ncbi:GNAT family N-acetyltransferase [Anaerotruncus sp. 1XD22-93]|nr:GNAT family N-acetyltransferase [Anaerotruncus sp. 1XD42-93]RKK00056.1 GNAT family N-acetyltransferase [Anaerotruncus sp. 1XD22-93]
MGCQLPPLLPNTASSSRCGSVCVWKAPALQFSGSFVIIEALGSSWLFSGASILYRMLSNRLTAASKGRGMNRMQKQGFSFEPAQPEDMEAVFGLIDARIQWMEERGIDQWDRQIYWEVFPRQYYEEARKQHRLFVLRQSHDCAVAGAVVLTDSDPRWEENQPARYLHNLVAAPTAKGAGSEILRCCEALARRQNCCCLRLDCVRSNEKLNRYYEAHGFVWVESFDDGGYLGNKREKSWEPPTASNGGVCT